MNTIIIDFKKKNKKKSLFPRSVLGITVGTIIKLLWRGQNFV